MALYRTLHPLYDLLLTQAKPQFLDKLRQLFCQFYLVHFARKMISKNLSFLVLPRSIDATNSAKNFFVQTI